MIQSIITRMAQNSFLIKGWSVTFAAGLLGLSSADDNTDLAWIAVGSVAVFAVLDAYYLAIESKYRDLYARAIEPGAPLVDARNRQGRRILRARRDRQSVGVVTPWRGARRRLRRWAARVAASPRAEDGALAQLVSRPRDPSTPSVESWSKSGPISPWSWVDLHGSESMRASACRPPGCRCPWRTLGATAEVARPRCR